MGLCNQPCDLFHFAGQLIAVEQLTLVSISEMLASRGVGSLKRKGEEKKQQKKIRKNILIEWRAWSQQQWQFSPVRPYCRCHSLDRPGRARQLISWCSGGKDGFNQPTDNLIRPGIGRYLLRFTPLCCLVTHSLVCMYVRVLCQGDSGGGLIEMK